MTSDSSHPEDGGRQRHGRVWPLCCAALTACIAVWLVPVLFPYLDPDPFLQRLLGSRLAASSALAQWAAALLYVLPYVLVGIVVYFRAARRVPPRPAPREAGDGHRTQMESRRERLWLRGIVLLLIAGLMWLAYLNRFVTDDAYISFRYARNLVEGAGLVYNAGERIEGYTNSLWVLLMAAGMSLGGSPIGCAQLLGLACFGGTLAVVYRLGRLVLPDPRWALVTMVLVGTQFSVLAFATGGLETSLQTFLLALGCLLVFSAHARRRWRTLDLVGLSLVLAAGVLTRMDFAIFGAVLLVSAAWSMRATVRDSGRRPRRPSEPGIAPTRGMVALLLPAALVVGAWLIGRACYYHSILPNTYYAKKPGPGAAGIGLAYLWDFCKTYRYQLPSVVFLLGVVPLVRERHVLLAGVAGVMVWCGYLVRMGGGFIEFRFLVPIVPLFLLCVLWTATRFSWSRRLHLPVFLAVWIAYGSLHHVRTFGWVQNRAEPVAHLKWQTEDALWAEAGKQLHRLFGRNDVVIATTVAGILPYHARLTTIDMHGLTDAAIARGGRKVSNRPGHKRFARMAYLKRRGVHLVIGHPKIEPVSTLHDVPAARLASCVQAADLSEEDALIVAIPITPRHVLLAWYLTPHPAVDRAIETQRWHTFIVRPAGR